MPAADEQHETDDRFPSGEWTGFFIQPDSRQRHVMDLFLRFARNRIHGMGNDSIGKFTIRGLYDANTAECSWTKQYVGQHSVEYTGGARQRGIVGQWRIPGLPASWSGPFFVWPREFGNLESAFEIAFLEFDMMSLMADSVSVPVEA